MRSNTDCWSNDQLNDRIEELEDKLEAIKNYLDKLEGTGNFIDKQKIMKIVEEK